jgi:hypothetical protein
VQVKLMDSKDCLEPILIPSQEAIVLLTLDCNTIKDPQMYLRQMVEAKSRSLIPVRVSAHFYPGAYATFNVFPPGKPGIVSSGNNQLRTPHQALMSRVLDRPQGL